MESNFTSIGPTTFLGPIPAVLIGCAEGDGWQRGEGSPNLLTVAWTGICCTKPPMLGISVRPERYSYGLIDRTGEFTVNLVGETLCRAMDACGVKSGRDEDKFTALGLHAIPAPTLTCAPALAEAPAYLCCKVRQKIPLGSHDLFLAEITDVRVSRTCLRADGSIDERAMRLVAFVHGQYRALGEQLGFFGYSVAGEKALKRRMPERAGEAEVKRKPRKNANHRPERGGKA